MKLLFVFFFSLLLTIKTGDYSIDPFLDYLQEKGYWDIILNIKYTFCDDVAIDICTKLTDSPHDCEIVVRVYMPPSPSRGCPDMPLEEIKKILARVPYIDSATKNTFTDSFLNQTIKKCCPSILLIL